MQANNEVKKIQKAYLEILNSHFKELWKKFQQSNLSPVQFLKETSPSEYTSQISIVHAGKQWSAIPFEANQLLDEISSFWAIHRDSLKNALKQSDRLNTQIGDLNARCHYYLNASIRLGLYFDSICLIEPFSIMAQRRNTVDGYFTGKLDDPQIVFVLLSYLEIRSLETLLLSDTDLPIIILIPPSGLIWGDNIFKQIEKIAQSNTYRLFSEVFNKPITSVGDLVSIFESNSVQTIEKNDQKQRYS
jgi:hypothetical protein